MSTKIVVDVEYRIGVLHEHATVKYMEVCVSTSFFPFILYRVPYIPYRTQILYTSLILYFNFNLWSEILLCNVLYGTVYHDL